MRMISKCWCRRAGPDAGGMNNKQCSLARQPGAPGAAATGHSVGLSTPSCRTARRCKPKHKDRATRLHAPCPTTSAACYYHGTDAQYAWSIMTHGFSLVNERWGRGWGNGMYLSGTGDFASTWGRIIIRCQLQSGTRLLWHEDYDRKVID